MCNILKHDDPRNSLSEKTIARYFRSEQIQASLSLTCHSFQRYWRKPPLYGGLTIWLRTTGLTIWLRTTCRSLCNQSIGNTTAQKLVPYEFNTSWKLSVVGKAVSWCFWTCRQHLILLTTVRYSLILKILGLLGWPLIGFVHTGVTLGKP